MAIATASGYPLRFRVLPATDSSRLAAVLWPLIALPLSLLVIVVALNLLLPLALLAWVIVLVTGRYPRTLYRWSSWMLAWLGESLAYLALLSPRFPWPQRVGSTPTEFSISYPGRSSRWVALGRFFTYTLMYYYVSLLALFLVVLIPVSVLATLVLGRPPRWLHGSLEGIIRSIVRFVGWAILLVDAYPPYNLSNDAQPSSNKTAFILLVLIPLLTILIIIAIIASASGGSFVDSDGYRYRDDAFGGFGAERNEWGGHERGDAPPSGERPDAWYGNEPLWRD